MSTVPESIPYELEACLGGSEIPFGVRERSARREKNHRVRAWLTMPLGT